MMKEKDIRRELFIICLFIIIFIIMISFILPKEIYVSELKPHRKIALNAEFKKDTLSACYGNKFFDELSHCQDISNKVKITGSVNPNKEGEYVLIYSVSYRGIDKVYNQTVDVVFDLEPNIDLKGNYYVTKCPNGSYDHPEFSVIDDKDGDITKKVKTFEKDNLMVYVATDSRGGESIQYRNINPIDATNPVLSLNGEKTIKIKLSSNFVDPGYEATDNCDGNINDKVIINSDVDMSKEGIYLIEYSLIDSSGNKTTDIRKVIVGNPTFPNQDKVIYLTFDDGPNSHTLELLNVLEKYNVEATFFVTGQYSKYNYLLKNIYDGGHTIGLHTYSHRFDLIYASPASFFADINLLNDLIMYYTGQKSNILRFAGGSSNQKTKRSKMTEIINQVNEKGFIYFDWNVDSDDTKYNNAEQVIASTINQINRKKDFYIILQHDPKIFTAAAAEGIIRYGLKNGYQFMPLDETSPVVHHR